MAFGITKVELKQWKQQVNKGDIAFLTHYWYDKRFPNCHSVTKVGCANVDKLIEWGKQHGLKQEWIHNKKKYPHFDLLGDKQKEILKKEKLHDHINEFNL